MTRSPFFRCQFRQDRHPTRGMEYRIRGRFEFRRPDPLDPTRSLFTRPLPFDLDTGAAETLVDDQFAVTNGFADFRQLGTPTRVIGYDAASTPLPAWRVYRWVRFRDYADGVSPFPAGDDGGLEHLEFRIAVVVVPGVTVTTPLFGLRDMHNFFGLVSSGDEYTFYPRRNPDGNYPAATDGGQGVREIP
jgi:hypothetical protein